MPSASTNRFSLGMSYPNETTPGVTPIAFKVTLPVTAASDLGGTPETVVSDVIRDDRQVSDLIKVNTSVTGSFETELSYDLALRKLYDSALMADSWTTETALGTSLAVTVSGDEITSVGTFSSVAVNDWIRIGVAGSSDASFYKVISVAGAPDTIQVHTTVSEANGTYALDVGGKRESGSDPIFVTLEKAYNDLSTPVYEYLRGMTVSTMAVSAPANSIPTVSFNFIGMSHETTTSQVNMGTNYPQSLTARPSFNTSSNLLNIGEGSTSGLQVCTEFSMEINNNVRERKAIASDGSLKPGLGEFNVTGQLSVYMQDNTLLEKLLNNTVTSLSFGFTKDADALIYDMPAVKFTEGLPEVSGKNEDVMLNLGFQAFRDPTLGYTLRQTTFSGPI